MTKTETVIDVIIEMIDAMPQTTGQATPETNIALDIGLDSLAMLDFVMRLEDRFDVSIPMDRLTEVQTVADLATTISDIQGS